MAVQFRDYYETLGVPKTATEDEIRSAFRKLARKYHPDVAKDKKAAEEKFKKINEAYEVLSDPEKRKKYDQLGARWKDYESYQRAQASAAAAGTQGSTQQPFDWSDFAAQGGPDGGRYEYRTVSPEDFQDLFGGDEQPFSDFFDTYFGGGGGGPSRRAPRPRAGSDLEYPVDVTLEEAYTGTNRILELQMPDGLDKARRLEVKIPPGVTDGSRVRVAGQGSPGRSGGRAGDLYLVVNVKPDSRFERRGDDLRTKVSAPLTTLVLGGEVQVPTAAGKR